MPKLTKKFIDTLEPQVKQFFMWDTELRGFGVRVWPSDKKVYVVKYRNKHGRQRKYTIGTHGALTPEQARALAQKVLMEVAQGNDPASTKKEDRESPTIADLGERFIREYSKKRNKPATTYGNENMLKNWVLPDLGQYKVKGVQRADIVKLHHKISQTAPYAANNTVRLLSRMFTLAEMWGLRPDNTNPCKHVMKNAEVKKERYLSSEELSRLSRVLEEAEKTQTETSHVIAAIRLLLNRGVVCAKSCT